MKRFIRRPLVALLLAAGLASGPAQADAPGRRFDLDSAWQAAIASDATLRAARAAADAGQELLPQARAQLLPQLSLSFNRSSNDLNNTAPNLAGQKVTTERSYPSRNDVLSLRQPILQPAQWAAVRQAEAQVADAEAVFDQSRQQLAMRLAEAYFSLLLADDQIALIDAQTAAHATQLDAARKALAAGSGTRTDIDEAQARLDLDTAQALEARQQRALARRQLQVLVGEPVSAVQPLDLTRLGASPPDAGELEEWLELAEQRSPELKALAARREAAAEEVRKARARHLPTLDAIAQYTRSASENINRIDSESKMSSIGLQLNVPLYTGGGTQSQVRQAVAELTRADENLAAQRLDLGTRMHREHRGITEGLLRTRALEQAVRSAEQVVISSRRSYQAGARTTLDVLNAEQQLATARRDLAQTRYASLVAYVRLQALAGVFDGDRLARLNQWLKH